MKIRQYELRYDRERKPVLEVLRTFESPLRDWNSSRVVVQEVNRLLGLDTFVEEKVVLVALDRDNAPLGLFVISSGTDLKAQSNLKGAITRGLLVGASKVILLHNHPLGACRPSEADLAVHDEAREAFRSVDLSYVDNLIVRPGEWCSLFYEEARRPDQGPRPA